MSLTAAFYGKCHPSADIIRIPISKNNTSHYYFFFSDSFDSVTTFVAKNYSSQKSKFVENFIETQTLRSETKHTPLSPLHPYKHTHTQTYIWMYLLNKNVHGMVAFIFIQKFHAPRALGEGRNIRIILNSMDSFCERWGCRKFMRILFRLALFFFTSRLSEKGFLQEKSKLFILNRMLYLFIALVSARRIHSLTFIELGIRVGIEAIKFCT